MSADTETVFDHRATGTLGKKRDTMLDNELHARPELGKALTRGFTLPGDGFTYGFKSDRKNGGVAEAVSSWGVNLPLPQLNREASTTVRDFPALNKAALKAGLVTADEQFAFRATHDIRKLTDEAKEKKERFKTRRLPPTMVFGISTRPSTPIFELLEHKYQDQWINERRASFAEQRKQEFREKGEYAKGNFTVNRAMVLRMHQDSVEPAPLWKMPKFTSKAAPHLSTFRTEAARKAAFKSDASDGIPRKGTEFHHGIYEPAQS